MSGRRRIAGAVVLLAAIGLTGSLATASTTPATWSQPQSLPKTIEDLSSISCPSEGMCLAAGQRAGTGLDFPSFVLSKKPVSAASWHFDERRDSGVWSIFDCASVRLCVAGYGGYYTGLWASRRPAQGPHSFKEVAKNFRADSIDCLTVSFCAAIGGVGSQPGPVLVSVEPTVPGSWHSRSTPPDGANIEAGTGEIACPSPQLCVVSGTGGDTSRVAILENPAGPGSRWLTTEVDPQAKNYSVIGGSCHSVPHYRSSACLSEQITGEACAAPSSCLLTTGYGTVITTSRVDGGPSAWSRTLIYGTGKADRGYYGLSDPVCFSSTLCYMLGARGDLLMSTAPFSPDPTSWHSVHIPHATNPRHLACPTPRLCFMTSYNSTSARLIAGHIG
jgi:hypothetical protein